MELLRKKYNRKEYEFTEDIVWKGGKSELCDAGLADYFYIPVEVNEVWLTLHHRPAKNRHRVEIKEWIREGKSKFNFPEIHFEDGSEFDEYALNKLLKPFCGRTLYLQCEYVE